MQPLLLLLAASTATFGQLIEGYNPSPDSPQSAALPATTWPWELKGAVVSGSGTATGSSIPTSFILPSSVSAAATSSAPSYSATAISINSGRKAKGPVENAAVMLAVVAGVAVWL
jgi:hypothetical protein